MQKIIISVQGVEIPLMVRHEGNGIMECETITQVDLGGGISVYPGALMRVPTNAKRGVSTKSVVTYHTPPKPADPQA